MGVSETQSFTVVVKIQTKPIWMFCVTSLYFTLTICVGCSVSKIGITLLLNTIAVRNIVYLTVRIAIILPNS